MNYRATRYALFDRTTGEFTPIGDGVVLVPPATVVGVEGGELSPDVLDVFGGVVATEGRRATLIVPADARVVAPHVVDTGDDTGGEAAGSEVADAAAELADELPGYARVEVLPDDKDELLDILFALNPDHEFNRRHGVDTLQDAIRALREG